MKNAPQKPDWFWPVISALRILERAGMVVSVLLLPATFLLGQDVADMVQLWVGVILALLIVIVVRFKLVRLYQGS